MWNLQPVRSTTFHPPPHHFSTISRDWSVPDLPPAWISRYVSPKYSIVDTCRQYHGLDELLDCLTLSVCGYFIWSKYCWPLVWGLQGAAGVQRPSSCEHSSSYVSLTLSFLSLLLSLAIKKSQVGDKWEEPPPITCWGVLYARPLQ